jgi:hypothetical protein
LSTMRPAFTAPGWEIFFALMTGWVLSPARKTITGIYRFADPGGTWTHDAFHRFVRCGAWDVADLWKILALALVTSQVPEVPGEPDVLIEIDIDDTLFHKSGRKMDGPGWWRDAVRSAGKRVVVALGLNLLVVTLRIRPVWGGEPLGLPILVLLHRKNGPKLTDLACQALDTVATWFPHRRIRCCADGAFASCLIPKGNQRITIISRMRRDAALYMLKPKSTGRRGRPRLRGARLGTPAKIGSSAKRWTTVTTDQRGYPRVRKVYARTLIWYAVTKVPVLLVISRDPTGKEHDDYWVCSDTKLPPATVVGAYTGRWSIEDTFRAVKQTIGAQQPQSWAGNAPERAATLGLLLYSLVWWWFLGLKPAQQAVAAPPWYADKVKPSFLDAVAALRTEIWRNQIFVNSNHGSISPKMTEVLLDALARAA